MKLLGADLRMGTNKFIFNCLGDEVTSEKIINSGVFFSGSVIMDSTNNHLIVFNLVNKKEMKYILNNIKYNKEVKIEIFAYDEYPKEIQYKSTWDKLN